MTTTKRKIRRAYQSGDPQMPMQPFRNMTVADALAELSILTHESDGRCRQRRVITVEIQARLPLLTDRRRLKVSAVLFRPGAVDDYLAGS